MTNNNTQAALCGKGKPSAKLASRTHNEVSAKALPQLNPSKTVGIESCLILPCVLIKNTPMPPTMTPIQPKPVK